LKVILLNLQVNRELPCRLGAMLRVECEEQQRLTWARPETDLLEQHNLRGKWMK
jgi:hypothetical protein